MILPVASNDIAALANDITAAAAELVGRLTHGERIGVGTPSEDAWRRLGRMSGELGAKVRDAIGVTA